LRNLLIAISLDHLQSGCKIPARVGQTMKATKLRIVVGLVFMFLHPLLGEAQNASFGLSAGLPLNDLAASTDGLVSATGRYTFGPAFRFSLPHRFGIDVDLLYKHFDFGSGSGPPVSVHRLELPLLLRYMFPGSPVHPFVHAGMSFNRIIAAGGSTACTDTAAGQGLYCIGGKPAAQLRHPHTSGPVIGAGVEFDRGGFRIAPELRITRWVDRNFGTRDSSLRSNLTQIELLFLLSF
jgi:hypothetical protein